MAADAYTELCVVKAAILARVPKGLDLIQAAALPLVTTTGNQLASAHPGNQPVPGPAGRVPANSESLLH